MTQPKTKNQLINFLESYSAFSSNDLPDITVEWINATIECLGNPILRIRLANIVLDADEVPDRFLVNLLATVLHSHAFCAQEACFALGWIGTSSATRVLRYALDDPDATVRKFALFILGEIGEETDIPLIAEMIADSDPSVREMSAFSLGWNQGDFRVGILERILQTYEVVDTNVVNMALDMIGSPRAQRLKEELMRSNEI